MELYQIRYFLSVCDTLNFTRASENCNVSQPSLTRAIKKLEDELGGELFRRERSRTHLSELGRAMQPLLQQSLDSALAAKAQAASYGRGETSTLNVGISSTIEIQLLLPALQELHRVMDGLKFNVIRKPAVELIQLLEDGDIELCITAIEDTVWDRINCWSLFSEELVGLVQANHHLGNGNSLVLSQLQNQQIVAHTGCEHGEKFSRCLEVEGIEPAGIHEMSDRGDLNAIVGNGLGIAIIPKSTRLSDDVAAIPISGLDLSRTVSLFAVSGRQYSIAASSFIQLLRAADWSRWETQPS